MRAAFIVMAALLFLTATGCARSQPKSVTSAGDRYVVAKASTDLFRYGPQQGTGPDRKLPRNTVVTVTNHAFGYARVKTSDGEEGYVALEDLRPAPASAPVAKVSSPAQQPRVRAQYTEPTLPPPEQPAAPGPSPSP